MGLFRKDKSSGLDQLDNFIESEWTPAEDQSAVSKGESARDVLAKQLDNMLDQRGVTASVRSQLRKADLKFTVTEYFMLHVVLSLGLGAIGFLVRGVFGGGLGVIVGFFAPRIYLGIKQGQRFKAFQDQLPDILNLWVNSLRAGYSIPQAM